MISGEAAAVAIYDRNAVLLRVGEAPNRGWSAYNVSRAFDGCGDTRIIEVSDVNHADQLLMSAWADDRALRLFLSLIDPEEPEEELEEYAQTVEELLGYDDVEHRLEWRLMASAIPVSPEINRIKGATGQAVKTMSLFDRVIAAQSVIAQVRNAFDQVNEATFGSDHEKAVCFEALVNDGSIYDIVCTIRSEADLSFLRLQIVARHRNFSTALQQFFAALQPGLKKISRAISYEIDSEFNYEKDDDVNATYRTSHVAYKQTKLQQKAVIERLKVHDYNAARRFADDLVAQQQKTSEREHIGMSLCLLAQAAKHYEVPELQLEWARRANEIDSSDIMTAGHLADALICTGRFVEAYAAIDETERRGDPLFAANMRARICRLEGRYREAYDLYLAAAEAYDTYPDVFFAWAGVAETLRDMGRDKDALYQYEKLVNRWPQNETLRTGLASVLMVVGRYYDAIRQFNIVLAHGSSIVAQNGRATAYKLSGSTADALRLYDKILESAPLNSVSLCGRAEVFRANDDLVGALEAYENATRLVAHSPIAIAGRAAVLLDLGRYSEAKAVYAEGLERFSSDENLSMGLARVLGREGKYQEALKLLDELIVRLPFNRWAKWTRGDVLRRMGHQTLALQAMDMVLRDWPDFGPAQASKIALLIQNGRLGEAKTLLDAENSFGEWTKAMLSAALQKTRADVGSALITLTNSLSRARTPRERRLIRCAIAAIDLESGRAEAAAHMAEFRIGEITNVVHFHAIAASGNLPRAKRILDKLSESEADKGYLSIVVEIARRFRVIPDSPLHSREWVGQQEEIALLLEAV
jgi:tetratricopeptide (TPR) repeat protein